MKGPKRLWGILVLLTPLCVFAQNLPLPAKPLLQPGVTYSAQLRNAAFAGPVQAQGVTWSCGKGQCHTQARWSAPTVAACAALAAKVGEIVRFGHASAALNAGDLASCNRGSAALPTVDARGVLPVATSALRTRRLQQFGDLRQSIARAEAQSAAERQRTEREEERRRRLALGYTHKYGQGRDCDDHRANVNPLAAEVCDHIDNNCDGAIDEGAQLALYLDADGDLHGDPKQRILACPSDQARASEEGRWLVTVGNDCDDTNPDQWHGCP